MHLCLLQKLVSNNKGRVQLILECELMEYSVKFRLMTINHGKLEKFIKVEGGRSNINPSLIQVRSLAQAVEPVDLKVSSAPKRTMQTIILILEKKPM